MMTGSLKKKRFYFFFLNFKKKGGGSLIRACSLIRSNTVFTFVYKLQVDLALRLSCTRVILFNSLKLITFQCTCSKNRLEHNCVAEDNFPFIIFLNKQ